MNLSAVGITRAFGPRPPGRRRCAPAFKFACGELVEPRGIVSTRLISGQVRCDRFGTSPVAHIISIDKISAMHGARDKRLALH